MEIALEVEKKIKETIEQNDYILDSVEYLTEDGNKFLRVIIDKRGFITVDDCVFITKLINPIIDNMDMPDDNYILDVCSKEKGCE